MYAFSKCKGRFELIFFLYIFSEGIKSQNSKLKIQVHSSSSGFSTEDFLLRFPTIGEEIFDQLDHENLVKCRVSSSFWCSIIDNSKIIWRRRIQNFYENHVEFHQHWKSVLKNIPRDRIKELALAVEQLYATITSRLNFNHSPLHITSECGFFSLHKFATEKILAIAPRPGILSKIANLVTNQSKSYAKNEINPRRKDGITPVHFAACYGHFDLFMYLADHLEDIFPLTNDGTSPLVFAAQYGYLAICKTIVERVKEPNLVDTNSGLTPLHTAAYNGYFDVCKLLIANIVDKNPRNKKENTPLHFAAEKGHYDVCKFIIEKIDVKNPKNNLNGSTPLHYAAANGHTDICRLIIDHLDDKNPRNDHGFTPLHWAADDGHFETYQLIFENIKEKNPASLTGETPLGLAGNNGRFQILKYAGNELANED